MVDLLDEPAELIWPLRRGETLSNHDWFPLHTHRLLGSDFVSLCIMDGHRADIGTALILWSESFRQDPAGTLPADDRLLAGLARFSSLADWMACRDRVMRGWKVVEVEGDDGLMHRRLGHVAFMMRIVEDMYRRKRGRDASSAARTQSVRKKRVRDKLEELGFRRLMKQPVVVSLVLETLDGADMFITADNVAAVLKEHHLDGGNVTRLPDRGG